MTALTLRYQGAVWGIGFSEAGGLFGGFASLADKTGYSVPRLDYDGTDVVDPDGNTVTGHFEVIVHVESDTSTESADRDELATDIYGLGITDLASSKEEALDDITSDLFSVARAQVEGAISDRGISATREEIQTVLDSFDQHQYFLDQQSRFEYVRWDRSSPVNGTPASEMEAREEVPDSGPIYLINDTQANKTVYFQYSNPFGDSLTESNWEGVAQQHRDQLAESRARQQITQDVIENL